jgi:hypothetical protein
MRCHRRDSSSIYVDGMWTEYATGEGMHFGVDGFERKLRLLYTEGCMTNTNYY